MIFKVCAKKDFPKSGRLVCEIEGESIVIACEKSKFFAFENKCPHVKAPLREAILYKNEIICVWHGWIFNLKNGKCLNEKADCLLKIYKVTLDKNDDLWIEI
ncbi:Rieske (2Fe-2S) protein [bacterium]|nr:Rieske (2Fe-2S) protein [bacterium]